MSREKNLDKRLALNTKRLTVVPRKPNTIELDPSDLMNKAVKEIDAQLSVHRHGPCHEALPANPPKKVIWVAGSAVNNAREIIDRCPFGIALTVFREEFEKLHVECDAHSYAKALQRLKSTKHVIIYNIKRGCLPTIASSSFWKTSRLASLRTFPKSNPSLPANGRRQFSSSFVAIKAHLSTTAILSATLLDSPDSKTPVTPRAKSPLL